MRPPVRPSFRRRDGVPPAGRDLLLVALFLALVDAIALLLLADNYLPSRRREALARAPGPLVLLARDRQIALSGWVRERLADAELSSSLLAAAHGDDAAPQLLDRFIGAYGYESALIVDSSGAVLLRRGSAQADEASAVEFARETMQGSAPKIDFRRAGRIPKIFTACRFTQPGTSRTAAVLFASDPYDYVYRLFAIASVASKTTETNLIGLYGEWGGAESLSRGESAADDDSQADPEGLRRQRAGPR